MKRGSDFGEFRPSTLIERKEFYEKEFSIRKVKSWFRGQKLPQLCAVDAGTSTGIIIDKNLKNQLLYFSFSDLKKKIKKYLPEDVYYDRSQYKDYKKVLKTLKFHDWNSQELVFDIDSDNIECDHPKEQIVCNKCVKGAYYWTKKLKRELEKNFKKIKVVYSGRGFHLHVLDKKASLLNRNERSELSEKLAEKYPIDPWVSRDYIRLIRLPYSLHAVVSRKAIPINLSKNFNEKDAIPKFLKK